MAKGFYTKNDPKNKLAGPGSAPEATPEPKFSDESKDKKDETVEYKVNGEVKKKTKNGKYVGRKKVKTEPTRPINIAIPVSVLEKLDTVKVCYGKNLTHYINKLIEKDIEANYDNYKHIADSLNSFK